MIESLQRKALLEESLTSLYRKGRVPRLRETYSDLAQRLGDRTFGRPLFRPRGAAPSVLINPAHLTANLSEIHRDLDIAFKDVSQYGDNFSAWSAGFTIRAANLRQRLLDQENQINRSLFALGGQGLDTFVENFTNLTNVDLTLTTAQVDTRLGSATLPVVSKSIIRLQPEQITLLTEHIPPGAIVVSKAFSNVFNTMQDQLWQAQLPLGGTYEAILKINAPGFEIGHAEIDTISPTQVRIETSLDASSWSLLGAETVQGAVHWDVSPREVKFIRVQVQGVEAHIRSIQLGVFKTAAQAEFISRAISLNTPLQQLRFDWKAQVFPGGRIDTYIGTSNQGPWQPISPGTFAVSGAVFETLLPGASATDFSADNLNDPTGLWQIVVSDRTKFPGLPTPLPNTGELWRGIGQMKVQSSLYAWDRTNDPFHLPEPKDWLTLPRIQTGYMSPVASGGDSAGIPISLFAQKQTLLLNSWQRGGKSWWGVAVQNNVVNKGTQDATNYKFTTYLYSDRNQQINQAGGGAFAINNTSGPSPGRYVCWSLYVNDERLAGSSWTYPTYPLGTVTNSYSTTVLADTPLNYYRFDDTNTTLVDRGSAAANGTYQNSTVPGAITHGVVGVPGILNSTTTAFYWDGQSSTPGTAQTPSGALPFGSSFSIEFWARDRRLGRPYTLLSRSGGMQISLGPVTTAGGPSYVFLYKASGLINPLDLSSVLIKIPLGDLNWHHIVFTCDGTNVYAYKDGALIATYSDTFSADSAGTLSITPGTTVPNYPCLAELAYYSTTLTATQILAHRTAGAGDGSEAGGDLSFSIPLKTGWNKIEVLVYQPQRSLLTAAMKASSQNVAILFTPDIFAFQPAVLWQTLPEQTEYPIWADGKAMTRVSEFSLHWNTPLWNKDRWAWRIDKTTGNSQIALLNYNPGLGQGQTLDGVYSGSPHVLRLRYPSAGSTSRNFFFRARFTRDLQAQQSPQLLQYQLTSE